MLSTTFQIVTAETWNQIYKLQQFEFEIKESLKIRERGCQGDHNSRSFSSPSEAFVV
jgi:hypothetical protein